jgi:hypothetical protein
MKDSMRRKVAEAADDPDELRARYEALDSVGRYAFVEAAREVLQEKHDAAELRARQTGHYEGVIRYQRTWEQLEAHHLGELLEIHEENVEGVGYLRDLLEGPFGVIDKRRVAEQYQMRWGIPAEHFEGVL